MNKWVKIFSILFILGAIAGGLGYFFIYNKPHVNYEKTDPDYSVSAEGLFASFRNNKVEAQQEYNGKVIEITGQLSAIDKAGEFTIAVFAIDEGMFGSEGVRATMLPNYANEINSHINKQITIKGYCTGFNDTDVILEKSSIIN
ncbi:MAG: OB-fold putative lipoprotein [Bacteroidales bacterium]|nr:OB-fold putative lipoprotein [Bacteroidales bacterium]MCF8403137.1 OB-fold putative lipoprotein [Bacteroidales bacterium]